MKALVPAALLAGAALTAALATGCADGSGSATTEPAAASSHTADADADAGEADPDAAEATGSGGCPTGSSPALPADFPANLPLPEGATVTGVDHRSGNRLVVSTVLRGGFPAALSFLQKRLPEAGYTLSEGEVEKDDAESDFSSATVSGRWTLRVVPGCPGGVYLTYLTAPRS